MPKPPKLGPPPFWSPELQRMIVTKHMPAPWQDYLMSLRDDLAKSRARMPAELHSFEDYRTEARCVAQQKEINQQINAIQDRWARIAGKPSLRNVGAGIFSAALFLGPLLYLLWHSRDLKKDIERHYKQAREPIENASILLFFQDFEQKDIPAEIWRTDDSVRISNPPGTGHSSYRSLTIEWMPSSQAYYRDFNIIFPLPNPLLRYLGIFFLAAATPEEQVWDFGSFLLWDSKSTHFASGFTYSQYNMLHPYSLLTLPYTAPIPVLANNRLLPPYYALYGWTMDIVDSSYFSICLNNVESMIKGKPIHSYPIVKPRIAHLSFFGSSSHPRRTLLKIDRIIVTNYGPPLSNYDPTWIIREEQLFPSSLTRPPKEIIVP